MYIVCTLYRKLIFKGGTGKAKVRNIQEDGKSAPVKTKDELLRELFLQYNIDLKNSRKLGSGRYSTVITASYVHSGDKNIHLEQVAIKVINTQKVTDEFRNKFLPREIECWNRLIHPNLVRMLGYYRAKDHVFLTMEFGCGGDMNGIAHRDLKLENIILFPNQGIKISDFGFARVVGDHLSQTYCGSRSYSAPEILIGEPYSPYKADVWSVGVIGFIIVTDSMPYRENQANPKIVEAQKNRAYSFPSNLRLSENCQYSINMMMTFSWIERPDIQQCWRLPWIYGCAT
uniref:Protein kinase domain-containing protein n=1 Tax=Heterorhabditis bacteriophora TaxID=37862 RepID=A0A1I7XPH0_HETBA